MPPSESREPEIGGILSSVRFIRTNFQSPPTVLPASVSHFSRDFALLLSLTVTTTMRRNQGLHQALVERGSKRLVEAQKVITG